MARFRDMYKSEVAPALMAKFNYKSPMQIPKFDKIVINVGAGDAKENPKVIDSIIDEIASGNMRVYQGDKIVDPVELTKLILNR